MEIINKLIDKLPDLVINILGVLIGGLLAYVIAKWQLTRQSSDRTVDDKKTLEHKFERLCNELRDNRNTVKQLYSSLHEMKSYTTQQQWEYVISIGNSLSLFYYQDLIRTGLNRHLPEEIDKEIYVSFRMIEDLYYFIHQTAKQSLALKSIPNPNQELVQPLNNLIAHTHTVQEHLIYSTDVIYKYKDTFVS